MSEYFKTGSFVVGLKQSLKAIKSGKAIGVFMASDADYHISSVISDACALADLVPDTSHTLSQLGKMCRIDVGAAVVTLICY